MPWETTLYLPKILAAHREVTIGPALALSMWPLDAALGVRHDIPCRRGRHPPWRGAAGTSLK